MQRALLCLVLLLAPRALLAADEDALPAFERVELVRLSADECQELRIEGIGRGVLEIRFFAEEPLRPAGWDLKTSGASLLIAAADPARASFLLYHASGIYQQSARLAAPIRWTRRGSELCIASGSRPVFCGPTAGELRGTVRIAFGPGWDTDLTGCAALATPTRPRGPWIAALALFAALAALALRISRGPLDVVAVVLLALGLACGVSAALDPWRLPSVGLLAAGAIGSALVAGRALLVRRLRWQERLPCTVLGLLVAGALVAVPHPVATPAAVEPAVPPLWIDTASWHPRAPHQSLDFRGQPLADVVAGQETWLVLGGSVVFGEGVEASETFTAVAQDLFRAEGDPIVLLNSGMQGWNIQNIDRFLTDLGDALPVTGIVLVSILNNATLPIAGERSRFCDRSLVLAHLCNVLRSQLLLTWPKAILPKPHNLERYRSTLRRLLERELVLGRRVVLLDEAAEFDRTPILWKAEPYRAAAAEIGAELGVAFHRVNDVVEALPAGDRFLDGIHPTPALHARLGYRLHEILRAP